jgi:uncharacterized membrane protein YhhN
MERMKKVSIVLFGVAAILEVVCQLYALEQLHHFVKPSLMVLLGLHYFTCVPSSERSNLVLGAIFFSFLGDSFLLYDHKNELYFMLGLGSFLLAHLAYIFAFRQHRNENEGDQLHTVQTVRMAFPVILAATGLVVVLYPHLGALKFPVIVYAFVLMLMVLNSLFRYGRTSATSFSLAFGGAVLFMISDSLLAINKFLQPFELGGVLIMITYMGGQYLIVKGMMRH